MALDAHHGFFYFVCGLIRNIIRQWRGDVDFNILDRFSIPFYEAFDNSYIFGKSGYFEVDKFGKMMLRQFGGGENATR